MQAVAKFLRAKEQASSHLIFASNSSTGKILICEHFQIEWDHSIPRLLVSFFRGQIPWTNSFFFFRGGGGGEGVGEELGSKFKQIFLHPWPVVFLSCQNHARVNVTQYQYGWRNGAKFTKFIFIHIQCSYWYSRIYLFTFNNRIYIQEIYLFTFTCVFLIHDYICSHSTSYIHSHSRSKYSFNIFCASPLRIGEYKTRTAEYGLRTTDWVE